MHVNGGFKKYGTEKLNMYRFFVSRNTNLLWGLKKWATRLENFNKVDDLMHELIE